MVRIPNPALLIIWGPYTCWDQHNNFQATSGSQCNCQGKHEQLLDYQSVNYSEIHMSRYIIWRWEVIIAWQCTIHYRSHWFICQNDWIIAPSMTAGISNVSALGNYIVLINNNTVTAWDGPTSIMTNSTIVHACSRCQNSAWDWLKLPRTYILHQLVRLLPSIYNVLYTVSSFEWRSAEGPTGATLRSPHYMWAYAIWFLWLCFHTQAAAITYETYKSKPIITPNNYYLYQLFEIELL